jgi:hypothetical protein
MKPKLNVMLVDDTRANLVAISFLFKRLENNFEINLIKCTSGNSAVKTFINTYEKMEIIHLMIVDFFMGSFNGDKVV